MVFRKRFQPASNKRGRFAVTKKRTFKRMPIRKRGVTKFKNNVKLGKGFPKKMTVDHKYVDNFTLTSTSGVMAKYVFNCNGLFDPNQTGTGHQPAYYDTLTGIYNHYTVIGAKITIKACYTAESNVPTYVSLTQDDDGSLSTSDIQTVAESSTGSIRLVGPKNQGITLLTNKWSAKKTFGGSVLGNDNLQGTVSTNPTEKTTWVIAIQAADVVSTTSMFVEVNISYIAVWEELKELVAS
jgi:hypothetical protein